MAQKCLPAVLYKLGLICPLSIELTAMRNMLDEEHRPPFLEGSGDKDSNSYVCGEIFGINVVIASLPSGSTGTGAAAHLVNSMSTTFPKVELRLLVGIGGGVPTEEHDIRLGDVVVSEQCDGYPGVVKYDLGARTVEGFVARGCLELPPTKFTKNVTKMKSDHETRSNKISKYIDDMLEKVPALKQHYSRRSSELDILFRSDYRHEGKKNTCERCEKSKMTDRPRRTTESPMVHYGLIASGDLVMKDGEERDRISASLRGSGPLCFEMEAGGATIYEKCLVIRGISDYADSHKNDEWQRYAASAAAGLAKELIYYLSEDKGMKGVLY
jgi:nucleoside phosphorylase